MTPPGSQPHTMPPSPTESQTSVEDYDELTRPPTTSRRRKPAPLVGNVPLEAIKNSARSGMGRAASYDALTGKQANPLQFRADDAELREILRRGMLRAKDVSGKNKTARSSATLSLPRSSRLSMDVMLMRPIARSMAFSPCFGWPCSSGSSRLGLRTGGDWVARWEPTRYCRPCSRGICWCFSLLMESCVR